MVWQQHNHIHFCYFIVNTHICICYNTFITHFIIVKNRFILNKVFSLDILTVLLCKLKLSVLLPNSILVENRLPMWLYNIPNSVLFCGHSYFILCNKICMIQYSMDIFILVKQHACIRVEIWWENLLCWCVPLFLH